MAKVLVSESNLTNIANAIREKNGSSNTYTPAQMATAISNIPTGGGITPTGSINITTNGTHDVTNYASAVVNVPTGSGSSEIRVSYPTNLHYQSIAFSYTNRNTTSNGVLTLKPSSVTILVNAATGYTPGTISINGVDTGASQVYTRILSDGDVITVSEAEEKVVSEYNLDTTMTVGAGSSSTYGYKSGEYGSLRDNQLVDGSSSYTVTGFYFTDNQTQYPLTVSLYSFGSPKTAKVCIGDSSTSNYWEVTWSSFPYATVSINSAAANYLKGCYSSGTTVPIKIAFI